ncbi:MAG: hypothetical protein K2X64_00895 [Rhodocyclaceae bacterium]|nr:hypothetical protein [Rhodocyclaceae bacterium]
MSIRHWVFAIALGLMFSASLGEAQEQAPEAQEQTATQQEEAQPLPIPFPVEIVEDQAATDARQRSEEEARQREIEDLIAQQGMNAATQSIDAATQDMRDYALYSTLLVALGTVMLGITLWLTRQANAAAMKSVEVTERMGRLQTQSYVSFAGTGMHFIHQDGETVAIQVRPQFKNTGQIPGVIVSAFCHIQFLPDLHKRLEYRFQRTPLNKTQLNISTGETRRIDSPPIPISAVLQASQEIKDLVVIGRVEYTDLFGGQPRHEDFCVAVRFHENPSRMVNGQFATHDWHAHQDYSIEID